MTDAFCTKCGEHPRMHHRTICRDCVNNYYREHRKKQNKGKVYKYRNDNICPSCKKNKRKHNCAYCRECGNKIKHASRIRCMSRPCSTCGVNPRSDKSRCKECRNAADRLRTALRRMDVDLKYRYDNICPHCNINPRKEGCAYCDGCNKERLKEWRNKQR